MKNTLERLFQHNNWANVLILDACCAMTDAQLDARPDPSSPWSVRHTLTHIVESQLGYWRLLTLPRDDRPDSTVPFAELRASVEESGAGLLALARMDASERTDDLLVTLDGYEVEPWVVMLQAINHATEHRRQIAAMLRALGVQPPVVDGWAYGAAVDAARRIAE